MRKTLLVLLGVLGVLIAVVVAVGYSLPVAHVATRTGVFPQPRDRVFTVLTAVESYPTWQSDLKAVDVLSEGPPKRWRERGNDDLTFEFVEVQPPARLMTRIADTDLPFGGTWTYELVPEGSGTRLTITERGEVYNPLFRFMSRFVFGHTATMEQFLADLKRQLG